MVARTVRKGPDGAVHLIVGDIGGTNARFALADFGSEAPVLTRFETLKVAEYPSISEALADYVGRLPSRPDRVVLALAIARSMLPGKMPNSHWQVDPQVLAADGRFPPPEIINDFEAQAHAVAAAPDTAFVHVMGPPIPPHEAGIVSVLGPGTGLGTAIVDRRFGTPRVIATEGGHIGFSPADEFERAVHARLEEEHGRVSAERVVSGPGLRAIVEVYAGAEGRAALPASDAALWTAAHAGKIAGGSAVLRRFASAFGAVAGDLALAQGAAAVVLSGGVSARLPIALFEAAFAERFLEKGRYRPIMKKMPVYRTELDEPGLRGAALYAARH